MRNRYEIKFNYGRKTRFFKRFDYMEEAERRLKEAKEVYFNSLQG